MKIDHLKAILEKLCSYTNVLLENIDVSSSEWYNTHVWTREQEHDFMVWLTNYLYENSEAQYQLYGIRNASLEACQRKASWFCMNYGWTTAE